MKTEMNDLFPLPPDPLSDADADYIRRVIAEFSAISPKCKCRDSRPTLLSSPGTGPHWRKLTCSICGKFFKWVAKQKKDPTP